MEGRIRQRGQLTYNAVAMEASTDQTRSLSWSGTSEAKRPGFCISKLASQRLWIAPLRESVTLGESAPWDRGQFQGKA